METTFKIKKLINEKGFYSNLELDVAKTINSGVNLKFQENTEWNYAIEFGVEYFYEQYRKIEKGGLEIHINYLHTQIVDSSCMVVFFSIVKALNNIMPIISDRFDINDFGEFIVPK